MKVYLIAYVAALVAFLIIDGLWLGVLAKTFYANQLGALLRKSILPLPALAFYLFYTAGIVLLAVRPAHPPVILSEVAMHGALLGLIAYGTYNMTNMATLEGWPVSLSLVDLVWGTLLTSIVATVSALAVQQLAPTL